MVFYEQDWFIRKIQDDIVQSLLDEGHEVDGRITRYALEPNVKLNQICLIW